MLLLTHLTVLTTVSKCICDLNDDAIGLAASGVYSVSALGQETEGKACNTCMENQRARVSLRIDHCMTRTNSTCRDMPLWVYQHNSSLRKSVHSAAREP